MNTSDLLDSLTFSSMFNVMQAGMWLLNDLEDYLRPKNLSQARLTVLLMLKEKGEGILNPAEIARMTGKTRPGITRMILRLEAEGLITVSKQEKDARSKSLQLSQEGELLLDEIIPAYNERIRSMSESLSEEDKELLNTLLKKIRFLDTQKVLL